jgi:hypothetical protein
MVARAKEGTIYGHLPAAVLLDIRPSGLYDALDINLSIVVKGIADSGCKDNYSPYIWRPSLMATILDLTINGHRIHSVEPSPDKGGVKEAILSSAHKVLSP